MVLGLAGCGDDGDRESTNATSDAGGLLDRVQPDPTGLRYANVSALRAELGLPADADPTSEPIGDASTSGDLLRSAMGSALLYMGAPEQPDLADAIDHGAVEEVAGNGVNGAPAIAVIRTSQPFDELRSALEERDYRPQGELLVREQESTINGDFTVVGDGGNGIVVLGDLPGTVKRAVDGAPGADAPTRELIEHVSGSFRYAQVYSRSCIRGIAEGNSFDPPMGELAVTVKGPASGERLLVPQSRIASSYLEFEPVEVKGDTVTVRARLKDRDVIGVGFVAAGLISPGQGEQDLYNC